MALLLTQQKEIKLTEIDKLENVVGKGGLNESNLTEIRTALGAKGEEGLVENVDTLGKLKIMSGEEKLTGESIESLKKDFKLGDESLLSEKSQTKLNKIEDLISEKGFKAKNLRKYFVKNPESFETTMADFLEGGRVGPNYGKLDDLIKSWKWRNIKLAAGAAAGVTAAVITAAFTLGGDETPTTNPLDGRCLDADGNPTKNKEDKLCCGKTKANELAIDCGRYIALFNSGESPEILPDAFKDWLGNESSPYCNLGPCSDPSKDPDKCYITGHDGFPTYGQECTPDPKDPACPKSDNKDLGVEKKLLFVALRHR